MSEITPIIAEQSPVQVSGGRVLVQVTVETVSFTPFLYHAAFMQCLLNFTTSTSLTALTVQHSQNQILI